MNRLLYALLLGLTFPWFLFDAWRRWRAAPSAGRRLFIQFGRLPGGLPHHGIWLHAVSLGEVRAAVSLVTTLRRRWPEVPVVISTTTETGAGAARALGVPHFYSPYDYRWVMRRVLRQLRPRLIVIMETELWPNWIRTAADMAVPVAIVNARLSDRSYRAYRRYGGALLRQTLARVDLICAQTEVDRERFVRLAGEARTAGDGRVVDCGNLKFDFQRPEASPWPLPVGRQVWLAASTHEGEEAMVLEAHRQLRSESQSTPLLILVPRHPERAASVEALAERAGLRVQCYSQLEKAETMPAGDTDVLLVDRTGVLMPFFAAVPVIFMGGSLVPVGGHNPIEPAVFGRAVISGPEVRNFRAIYAGLQAADAVRMIGAAAELAPAVRQAWQGADHWALVGSRAEAVVAENRGSTARLVERLAVLLG